MTDTTKDIKARLLHYVQADNQGVMAKIQRQALHEAHDHIESQESRIAELEFQLAALSSAAQGEPPKIVYVPANKDDAHREFSKTPRPFDPECNAALDAMGDDSGQGLDPFWKYGFRSGWDSHKNALVAHPSHSSAAREELRICDTCGANRRQQDCINRANCGFPEAVAPDQMLAALQAKIDELMLEYCPDEMTAEQYDNWAKHQRPVSAEKKAEINALLKSAPAVEPVSDKGAKK